MPLTQYTFRLSDEMIDKLDRLGARFGGLDRSNVIRLIITEAADIHLAEKLPEKRRRRLDNASTAV